MLLVLLCDCSGRFVSDQVRNPEGRLSQVLAHLPVVASCGVGSIVIAVWEPVYRCFPFLLVPGFLGAWKWMK